MLTRRIIIIAGLLLVLIGLNGFAKVNEAPLLDKRLNKRVPAAAKAAYQVPAYKEGEIIVKFKGQAADILDGKAFEGTELDWLELSPSLDKIGSKYGVGKIGPVIKNFKAKRQRIEELKTKEKASLTKREKHLLRRLKRAPKGAKVPDLGRIYKVELGPGQSAPWAAAEYNRDPDVEYAELNYIYSTCSTEPDDPCYPVQWPLSNIGQMYPYSGDYTTPPGTENCDIDANEAWDINTGSSNVIVAVIDTGVDYNHNDIKANMWTDANGCYGYDFVNDDNDPMDDNGHGTHCAGIIAADGNNGLDIAGVCWTAQIMAVKSANAQGELSEDDVIAGIEYAVDNGADITSNSWGGPPSKAIEEVFDDAYSQGVVMIAAAGNYDTSFPFYPAAHDSVVAVAATDSDDQRATFSNYGDWIDVAAPGVDILSLRANGTSMGMPVGDYLTVVSGTSMACPHVAGLAALSLAEEPNNLTAGEVIAFIKFAVDDIGDPNIGTGRINAYKALYNISEQTEPNKATEPFPTNDANLISVNVDLSWAADGLVSLQDVYLGTNYNDVNDANTSSPEYKDTIDVFISVMYEPNTLEPNSTYYWRIDSWIQNRVTKGDVWSFSTRNGNVYYVDSDANGSDNGTSWTDAYNSLDDAIPEPWGGDEIWAAEGTYKPDSNDRTDSFVMREGINIHGGFDGTESSKNQRDKDLSVDVTTLSGDIGAVNDVSDNCYHVVTGADGIILDRFTITGGNAHGSSPYNCGGGMYNAYGSTGITVKDCLFTKNKAVASGGGMCNKDVNDIIITGCTFTSNEATYYGVGGGMCSLQSIYGISTITSIITVKDCLFTTNKAYDGGGIQCSNIVGEVTITGCTFISNEASSEVGGMYFVFCGECTISDCIISKNSSVSETGGLLYIGDSDWTISNCVISENSGGGDYWSGGGLSNWGDSLTLTNCIIWGNKTSYRGGGLVNYYPATVTNCTFTGNTANTYGGGMYNCDSTLITNCIFWDNKAGTYGNEINNSGAYPNISYCDIKDSNGSGANWVPGLGSDDGGNIDADPCFTNVYDFYDYTTDASTTTTIKVADASLYVVNDVIEYDNDGNVRTVTDVNTTTDIVTFANDALDSASASDIRIHNWGIGTTDLEENFHLLFTYDANQYSVCMDTANPNSPSDANDYDPYDGNSMDIDGQLRAMDGDDDGNSVVDMGADEVPWPCLTCVGDVVAPFEVVNLNDFSKIAGNLRKANKLSGEWLILPYDSVTGYLWKSCSDMDQDYDIDLDDYNDIFDNLSTAYSLYGVLEYECGDPLSFHFYVSPDGSDNNDGLSWATAFATIQHGLDVAGNSVIVEVNEGTYYETIDFKGVSCTLTSTDPNDDNVVGATIIDANGTGYAVEFSSGEDATSILTGFTVTGGSNYGVYCSGSSPVITRCIIEGNTDGIGIYISDDSSAPAIKNNLIYDNEKGISFGNANSGSIVCNNTIVGNTTSGIYKTQGNNPSISNCVVWNCNDDLYNCSATYSCIQDGDAGTGNISGYPLFVDVNNDNYRLDRNSPCVDAGNGNTAPATDMDGQARIDIPEITNTGTGTPNYTDIGAYETDTNSPTNTTCETAKGIELDTQYTGSTVDAADGVLWFVFTLEEEACIEIELCDSDFDTTLTLYDEYEEGGCDELEEVEFNNDYVSCGDGTQSKIESLELDGETPYFLKVAGNNGARGNYALEVVYEGEECEEENR